MSDISDWQFGLGVTIGFGTDHIEVHWSLHAGLPPPPEPTQTETAERAVSAVISSLSDEQVAQAIQCIKDLYERIPA